jgi:chemotaxis protein histidine kinase CheA
MVEIESKGNYEIHHPPNRLGSIVTQSGGPSLDEIVAKASVGLERLAERYPEIATRSIAEMTARVRAMESGTRPAENLRALAKAAHDIKGQAATFGYPLLGDIAASLCQMVFEHEAVALQRTDLLSLYVRSMIWVMDQSIRDATDAKGRELFASLADATARAVVPD